MKMTEFLNTTHSPYSMFHVLDVVKAGVSEEEIAHFINDFRKDDMISLSYAGTYPFHSYLMYVPLDRWKTDYNMYVRSAYRSGITKKQLLSCRKVMELIYPEECDHSSNFNRRTWLYFTIYPYLGDPPVNMTKYEYTKKWLDEHEKS